MGSMASPPSVRQRPPVIRTAWKGGSRRRESRGRMDRRPPAAACESSSVGSRPSGQLELLGEILERRAAPAGRGRRRVRRTGRRRGLGGDALVEEQVGDPAGLGAHRGGERRGADAVSSVKRRPAWFTSMAPSADQRCLDERTPPAWRGRGHHAAVELAIPARLRARVEARRRAAVRARWRKRGDGGAMRPTGRRRQRSRRRR